MKTIDQVTLAFHFEKAFGTQPRIFRAPGPRQPDRRAHRLQRRLRYARRRWLLDLRGDCPAAGSQAGDPIRANFPAISNSISIICPKSASARGVTTCSALPPFCGRAAFKLAGANLLVHGKVPIGAGLSSSAALEVSSAFALLSLTDASLPLPEVAKLCRQAENSFVGARVGIMDQFVSCMGKAGHAFFLDCRSLDFKLVPIPADLRLVVCNTMVKHDLATGAYNKRREECEEGVASFREMGSCDSCFARCVGGTAGPTCQRSARHDLEALLPRRPREPANARRGSRSHRRRLGASGKINARVAQQPARPLRSQLPGTRHHGRGR